MSQEDIRSLSEAQLQQRVSEGLLSSWAFTAVGVALAIPLSRYVKQKFLPLTVLGVAGTLLDYRRGKALAAPYLEELERRKPTTGTEL